MAVLTPRRSGGLNDLLRRMRGQLFTRRRKLEISVVYCVANECFQENWFLRTTNAQTILHRTALQSGPADGAQIVDESLHHPQQRDVCFGDRLKEPLLPEKMLVLR